MLDCLVVFNKLNNKHEDEDEEHRKIHSNNSIMQ